MFAYPVFLYELIKSEYTNFSTIELISSEPWLPPTKPIETILSIFENGFKLVFTTGPVYINFLLLMFSVLSKEVKTL